MPASADSANGKGAGQANGQGQGQGNTSAQVAGTTTSNNNGNGAKPAGGGSNAAPGNNGSGNANGQANGNAGQNTPPGCANGNDQKNGQSATAPGCDHSQPSQPANQQGQNGNNGNGNGPNSDQQAGDQANNQHGSIEKTVSSVNGGTPTCIEAATNPNGCRGSHAAAVHPGDIVSWAIAVSGPSASEGNTVQISDEYKPTQEEFVSADNGGHVSGNKVVWDNIDLSGGPVTVILTTRVGGRTTGFHCNEVITNVGHVDGIGSDKAQVRVVCGEASPSSQQAGVNLPQPSPQSPVEVTTTSPIEIPSTQPGGQPTEIPQGTTITVLSGTISAGGEVAGATITAPGLSGPVEVPSVFMAQVAGVSIPGGQQAGAEIPAALPSTGGGWGA